MAPNGTRAGTQHPLLRRPYALMHAHRRLADVANASQTLHLMNDGKTIVTGDWDGKMRVWRDNECIAEPDGHGEGITCMACIARGRRRAPPDTPPRARPLQRCVAEREPPQTRKRVPEQEAAVSASMPPLPPAAHTTTSLLGSARDRLVSTACACGGRGNHRWATATTCS